MIQSVRFQAALPHATGVRRASAASPGGTHQAQPLRSSTPKFSGIQDNWPLIKGGAYTAAGLILVGVLPFVDIVGLGGLGALAFGAYKGIEAYGNQNDGKGD